MIVVVKTRTVCLEAVVVIRTTQMLFGFVGKNEGSAAVVTVYDCFVGLLVVLKYISCQNVVTDLLSGMQVCLLGMTSLQIRQKAVGRVRASLFVRA